MTYQRARGSSRRRVDAERRRSGLVQVRNQRPLEPCGHRDGLREQCRLGDGRAGRPDLDQMVTTGIASGSVLRSGWNVGHANVPSR